MRGGITERGVRLVREWPRNRAGWVAAGGDICVCEGEQLGGQQEEEWQMADEQAFINKFTSQE